MLKDEEPSELPRLIRSLRYVRSSWNTHPPDHVDGLIPVFSTVIAPDQDAGSVRAAWTEAGALLTEVRVNRPPS